MLVGSYLFSDYIEKQFDAIRFKELFGDKKIKKGFKNVGKYIVYGFYKKDCYTRIVASEICSFIKNMENMDKESLEYDEILSITTDALNKMIYNHIHNDEILLDYARDDYYLEDLRIDFFEEEDGTARFEIHCFMKHKDGRVSGDLEKVLFEIGGAE